MRRIEVRQTGGPEVLEVVEHELGGPAADEIVVRLEAAGVNFIDIYHRTGLYPRPLPFVPGQEGAGVVEEKGADVSGIEVGDRVAWAPVPGSYAEKRTISADRVVVVPDEVETATAAAAMLQGMTAHYLCHDIVELGESSTALVHAAAGGVGRILVQMLANQGVTVYGTAGTAEKAAIAREAGAAEVIEYRTHDFREAVADLTNGKGVDVVFDSVGADTFERSLASLAPRGTLVSFGQSSGPVPPFEIRNLSQGSWSLIRPSLGHYVATREALRERAARLFDLIGQGAVTIEIDSEFELGQASRAHERLESRASAGKILLVMES